MRIHSLAALVLLVLTGGCKSRSDTSSAQLPAGSPPAAGAKKASPPQPDPLPLIDSHVHIAPTPEAIDLALGIFSRTNVVKFAVKSAGVPGELRYELTLQLAQLLGERMAFFTNPDWEGIDEAGWGAREADRLELAMRQGASGIKIFKDLGLGVRLKDGSLLQVNDGRLEPLWQRAAKVGAIVAWHIADPVAFFKPINEQNERYEELKLAPDWSFYGQDYPSYEELMAQRDKVVAAHPQTTFLGIHLASYPEDLDQAAKLLDRCPNMLVDVSARVPEIGHHPPDKARAFFIKYQERILFGTDLIVTPRGMQLGSVSPEPPTVADALKFYADHRRYFETADRDFAHPTPIQGNWKISGIDLPRDVLQKIYYDNADRLIFAKRRAWLRAQEKGATSSP